MSYATATMTSTTPAKDLMTALGTQLTAGGMTLVESYGVPAVGVWQSVTYGNGLFVAVATASATAATSPDGITWTQRTLPASANWTSVTYGGGQFVAVASGTAAATSPDGITWTARVLPTSTAWSAVTYGGGMFVAVVSNTSANITASSPDGITWTARNVPALSQAWTGVAYGNGKFVAVTSTGLSVITSPDGITWTQQTSKVASGMVCFGNGLFVAGGSNTATAQTSPDGITWTLRALPAVTYWPSVAYGGGQFLAVTQVGVAATSPDGITWTQRTPPGPGATAWQSVAYGAGLFVVTASSGSTIAAGTTPDGITWTTRSLTATTASATCDVYRSPAASNQFGQDWYLILGRASDTNPGLWYQVAEGYNQATHTVSTYGGRGVATVPVAGTYANPLPPLTLDTGVSSVFAANAYLALTTAAFTYWVSANANRVILGVKTSAEAGFYAGLYDDLLPAGVTGFPLVCAKFPTAQATGGAIGSSTLVQVGGFTREPGQAAPAPQALNFEAGIHNGYWAYNNGVGFSAIVPGNFTPMTSTTPLYGNPNSLSRAMIGTTRPASAGVGDGVRGLLIGCVTSAVNSAAGDTTVAGGKTYVRFTGAAATFGFFVDTSL